METEEKKEKNSVLLSLALLGLVLLGLVLLGLVLSSPVRKFFF